MKYLLIFLLLISSGNLYSQSDKQLYNIGGNILAKGKVSDEISLLPVGTDIEFRHESGKKIKTQSNSISGEWEQLLPEGKYSVILYSWNVARKIDQLEIPAAEKYKEIHKDFNVKRMFVGDKVFLMPAFASNNSTFQSSAKEEIEMLKDVMKFNRAVEFIVYVNASDMFPPQATSQTQPDNQVPVKGKKPKKQTKPAKAAPTQKAEPIKADFSTLIQKRLSEVEQHFADWGNFKSRIKIEADLDNSKCGYPNNFVILVSKNEDLFKK